MARIPMVVAVECDEPECQEGIIVHNKDEGIGLNLLENHLQQEGWTGTINKQTGLKDDVCPACTKRRAAQAKAKEDA